MTVLTADLTGIDVLAEIERLRKGRSRVLEHGHTLVLGWSPRLPTVLSELVEANANHRRAAVVVLSDQDSARAAALNMLRFFEDESCGQCTPCRVGCEKAVKLMQAAHWDTDLLQALAQTMEDASICGLGQAAPNAIRLTIKHFPQEV